MTGVFPASKLRDFGELRVESAIRRSYIEEDSPSVIGKH
jgi:hypothetical protein